MKQPIYFIALLALLSSFFACSNDDNFSTNSNLRLSFSVDTLRFDTVFTTIGSATRRLKVYNRNREALHINSVELVNAAKTGFRMNVDGISGNKVTDVDILGRDSMYIFVEVTVNPLNQNNPMLVEDSIRLTFNGVTQYVNLEAIGQDVVLWRDKTIDKDMVLTGEKPFLVFGGLTVSKDATLDMRKNVRMFFHSGAKVLINGRINAVGTIEEPVLFRGDRLDNLYQSGNVPFDRVPGQWGGIEIASDSYDNRFENVRIRNGIYGVLCHTAQPTRQKAIFMNTIIQNTSKEAFWAVNCKIDAANTLFANAGSYTLRLLGGSYDFLHCTVASYIDPGWGFLPRQNAMLLANTGVDVSGKTVTYPLIDTHFTSTIIAGRGFSELELRQAGSGVSFAHSFVNCLIKNRGSDDNEFVSTVWNEDPRFRFIYSFELAAGNPDLFYFYDFRLSDNSPAINKGSRQAVVALPYDLVGASRRSDEAPDIGCFEWKSN